MPTINQLPSIDEVSGGNQIPTYYSGGGDARKMSVNLLQDYLQDNLNFPDNASEITYNPAGTGAVARTVEAKLRDVVSVKDFGAVGDGITDDTAEIQAAIDAVSAAGGGTVFIPRGNYLTGTLTLKSHVHLVGEERGQLGADGLDKASAFIQLNTTGDVISTVTGTTTYNCGVHNLAIKGKGAIATSGRGIFFSPYVTWSTIENCNIQGFADEGVFLSGTVNQMSGCFVGYNTRYNPASLSFYKGQVFIGGTDQFVTQNEIHGLEQPTSINGWPPTNTNLYCCAVLVQTASSFITRNIFEIADIGMVVISKHINSTSFSKTDPYYPGACHGNSVFQNRCDYSFGHGIRVVSTNSFGGPYSCSFVGNHIAQCGLAANNTYDGINISKDGGFFPYNNIYVNNHIYNTSGFANNLKYGINSDAFSSQNTTQRDLFANNRARIGYGVVTASTNGVASNDYYEESTFTPTITFTTPGDLTAVYNVQTGRYTRIGDRVFYNIVISATTFTHTTASGNLRINGLPYTAANVSDNYASGSCSFEGYTAAGYTSVSCMSLPNNTSLELIANGSGVARKVLAAADIPSGSNKYIMCSGHYDV